MKNAWTETVEAQEKRIKELEEALRINAHLLARQTDLAREAETEVRRLTAALGREKLCSPSY